MDCLILIPTYIAQLDYVDLRNLCKTKKLYATVCDDLSIKSILTITIPNIVFKMNVAKLLKELDNKIEKLINIHYFNMPKWVNVELFTIEMKKKIYYNLAKKLNFTLHENLDSRGKFAVNMLRDDGSLKLNLYNESLAFALISNEFYIPDFDSDIDLHENYIVLSGEFLEYLMTALGRYQNYYQAKPIIKNILFLRNK